MNNPKQIGGIIQKTLVRLGLWDSVQEERLLTDWENLVGDKIARYTKPVNFQDGELWLIVEDPVWRTQIFNIKEALISMLNEKLGKRTIQRIRIF